MLATALVEKLALNSETSLMNFDMVKARDAAWFAAERLAAEPQILQDITIDALDLGVSIEGRAILYPPHGDCEALKLIQQAESTDVRLIIETLSQGNSSAPASTA